MSEHTANKHSDCISQPDSFSRNNSTQQNTFCCSVDHHHHHFHHHVHLQLHGDSELKVRRFSLSLLKVPAYLHLYHLLYLLLFLFLLLYYPHHHLLYHLLYAFSTTASYSFITFSPTCPSPVPPLRLPPAPLLPTPAGCPVGLSVPPHLDD